ncbi:MAG: hypothetical protein QOF76_4898 [Solirubrobacteraceae bacterium]|jgi:SAM-dependent methyltransferase|nr:hypothetical protein [Solirubrobacteraceae bacterium]
MSPSALLAPLPFALCADCGFQQRDDQDVAAHYLDDEYGADRAADFVGSGAARRRDAKLRLKLVGEFVDAGRLLDVGTADGSFVAVAAEAGFAASGLEPTPTFAAHARAQGLDVHETALENAALEPASFDAISMWHVLEHVAEPAAALALVRDALKPSGMFFVEVPNAGSAMAQGMGTAWPMLEPSVHVGQFTGTALRALLERCGFSVRLLRADPILAYTPLPDRYAPGALLHRLKWRGEPELLLAVASRA